MAVTLPTVQDRAFYEFDTLLDGATYTFTFHWGAREAAWFMSIALADGTPVAVNVKVVVGFPLAARNATGTPPGTLLAVDTSGRGAEATYSDLGTRVQLVYYALGEPVV